MRAALGQILHQMTSSRRRQFYALLALMVVGAFAELAAIGAVLPFLSLLANASEVQKIAVLSDLFEALGIRSNRDLLIAATAFFALTAIAAAAVRLWLTWVTQAFVFGMGHDLGVDIHRRMLYQPYAYHVAHNTSQVISALEKVQLLVMGVLLPLMTAASGALISLFIIAILIYVDPLTAAIAAGGFCVVYGLVSVVTRDRLNRNSNAINAAYAQRVQAVQESLGGIRDIILDQSQPVYVDQFARIDRHFRDAQAVNTFIAASPRYVIEAAGMVLIAVLALMMAGREGGLAAGIPVLGALALGAQRLLPLLQQIYVGWAQIAGSRAIVFDIVALMRLPGPSAAAAVPVPFQSEIRFEKVDFAYPSRAELVLGDIDLVIPKGSKVALIGKTGSGKSTLIDLLMGLLEPLDGRISVDGTPLTGASRLGWQSQIAHVPQAIFLSDTTIERNIAFGIGDRAVDRARVEAAAEQAQLHAFIQGLPDGYETRVGERGVQLSGGQRQRLGIARALYKAAPVLILDEATSALDDATEAAFIRSLHGLDDQLTIVMIAHRLSTIAGCDFVVRMEGGRILEIGSYAEVVAALRPETL